MAARVCVCLYNFVRLSLCVVIGGGGGGGVVNCGGGGGGGGGGGVVVVFGVVAVVVVVVVVVIGVCVHLDGETCFVAVVARAAGCCSR